LDVVSLLLLLHARHELPKPEPLVFKKKIGVVYISWSIIYDIAEPGNPIEFFIGHDES
jgi:hypothetical protein